MVRSHSRREIVQNLDTGIDIAIDITYNTRLSFVIHSVMKVARGCKHCRKVYNLGQHTFLAMIATFFN